VVEVGGRLTTQVSERVLIAEHIQKTGETFHLRPVGVSGRNLGSTGPDTSGLLAIAWGRVSSVGDGFFYLDDGSAQSDCTSSPGIRVDSAVLSAPPSSGDFGVVTGVLSMVLADCGPALVIRPRTAADIVLYPAE
jgi:hypothetical protein